MINRKSVDIDRRHFLRLSASVSIKFRRISDGKVVNRQKITKDISISGIRFLSDEFIPVSSYLKVNLSLRRSVKPLEFICRVVRIKSVFNAETYEIGAQILQIDKESYNQIKKYIYR